MIKTITPGAAYLHPAISSIYLGTVNPDDHSRFGFTDYIGNFLGPDTPLMDALILLYEPDPDASYWETAAAAGALRRLLSDVGLGRLDQLNGEHAVSLTDSEVHHPDRVRLVWDRKTLAGVYGTKEGAAVHLSRLGKHGKISENLLVDYDPTKVFFPCPHLKQEPNMTTQPEKEPATPSDFIEGAAYVSPSRNQVYIYRESSECLHRGGTSGGESYWIYEEEFDPIPDDLVMIWAPGDELPTRVIRDPEHPETVRLEPPVALKAGDTFYPSAVQRGIPIHTPYNATHVHGLPATHPFGGTLISSKDVPQETVMRIFESATNDDPVVKYDPDGTLAYQHPKTRGWFYPTRYNETPGLYEDELENPEGFGNRWEYRDADPSGYGDAAKSWLEVDTGTRHAVPNDGASAVAVRWRCKLDA